MKVNHKKRNLLYALYNVAQPFAFPFITASNRATVTQGSLQSHEEGQFRRRFHP